MRTLILSMVCLLVLCGCSSDEENIEVLERDFVFEVTGAVNMTMSGIRIFYNETTMDTKNGFGEDTKLTTLFFWAEDGNEVVTFAITLEGDGIETGNYNVGSDVLSFYNVFMNLSRDKGKEVSYKSKTGSISLNSRSLFTTGEVNVTCEGDGGSITIKGHFAAESVD